MDSLTTSAMCESGSSKVKLFCLFDIFQSWAAMAGPVYWLKKCQHTQDSTNIFEFTLKLTPKLHILTKSKIKNKFDYALSTVSVKLKNISKKVSGISLNSKNLIIHSHTFIKLSNLALMTRKCIFNNNTKTTLISRRSASLLSHN